MRLLGVAASLRNARWGRGGRDLLQSLKGLEDEAALRAWLKAESELHLEQFLRAGRAEGQDFLKISANLRKLSGRKGLSNSETMLAAALWSAWKGGVEIDHLSLAEHHRGPEPGPELDAQVRAADGILLSGPVYFGDRGSLAESFIRRLEQLGVAGKLYGGLAVGAKRNGGQETTLVYQMADFLDLGCLAVGNDSDTTAQYGGTGVAGDVGTMHADDYGLGTAMGTGRRMASVLQCLEAERVLRGPLRVLFVVLREKEGRAKAAAEAMARRFGEGIEATIIDATTQRIRRCIACDICPTHVDTDEVYRCIIKGSDDMQRLHPKLLQHDLIVPMVATGSGAADAYQRFIERTRYLRRGDYALGDAMVHPVTLGPPRGTWLMRMSTSLVRHHTVLCRPTAAPDLEGWLPNFEATLAQARRLAAGRLSVELAQTRYRPVGYVLSSNKDLEDERLGAREEMIEQRREHLRAAAIERLVE